jgi:hypothetical protein
MSLLAAMQADALEAQKFSRKHLVLELDFSAHSIAELEQQADSVEYALAGGKSPANMEMLTRTWGAYLGEALRRQTGGEWVQGDDQRVGLRTPAATVFPHEVVRRRLVEGKNANLTTFFSEALQQLGSGPATS